MHPWPVLDRGVGESASAKGGAWEKSVVEDGELVVGGSQRYAWEVQQG